MYKIEFKESSGVTSVRVGDIEKNTWFLSQVDGKPALILNAGDYLTGVSSKMRRIIVIFYINEEKFIVIRYNLDAMFYNIQKVRVTFGEVKVKTIDETTLINSSPRGALDNNYLYLYDYCGTGHIVIGGIKDNMQGDFISLTSGTSIKSAEDDPQNNKYLFPVEVTLKVSNIS